MSSDTAEPIVQGVRPPPGKRNDWLVIGGILGAVAFLGCGGIATIAAIAIPNLIEARKGANEAAAIGGLRTITTAQALFYEGDKDRDGVLDYAILLQELRGAGLIDDALASGNKQGYIFETGAEGIPPSRWMTTARPAEPGKTGDRWFYVDESGVIRFERGRPATRRSPPLGG